MVPLGLLRAALGLLCLFFAHFLGRSAVRFCQGAEPGAKTTAWVLRVALAYGAILWSGGLDILAVIILVLTALVLAVGIYVQLHPPKEEDLSRQIFPKE